MRIVVAIFFIVHGIAHLPGLAVPWRLAILGEMPYSSTIPIGAFDVGSLGIRLVGILWLLAGLGFVVTAAAAFLSTPAWPIVALGVTLFSLGLTVLGWPDAWISA
jgi:hypothetical protein